MEDHELALESEHHLGDQLAGKRALKNLKYIQAQDVLMN
jgi:hypothetical protein